jgi:hypothetical protein
VRMPVILYCGVNAIIFLNCQCRSNFLDSSHSQPLFSPIGEGASSHLPSAPPPQWAGQAWGVRSAGGPPPPWAGPPRDSPVIKTDLNIYVVTLWSGEGVGIL